MHISVGMGLSNFVSKIWITAAFNLSICPVDMWGRPHLSLQIFILCSEDKIMSGKTAMDRNSAFVCPQRLRLSYH
jgi:hypothetical protein